jgi:hypothetical protein
LSAARPPAAAAAMQATIILLDLYRSINDVEVTTFEESIDVLNGAEIAGWGKCHGRNTARHGTRHVDTNEGSVLPACEAVLFRSKVVLPSSGVLCSAR